MQAGTKRFLNEDLMKAAEALMHHGECVEVIFTIPGAVRRCRLVGRGKEPQSVLLSIWGYVNGYPVKKQASREIHFEECELDPLTAARLELVAAVQETTPDLAAQQAERGRRVAANGTAWIECMAFIDRLQKQGRSRNRSGQFTDQFHRSQK